MRNAQKEKNDEFYTLLSDIEKELENYKEELKDKVIFCNCDDPEYSNFWFYFKHNFHNLKIKKVISMHYKDGLNSYKLEFDGLHETKTILKGNGDFRSDESIEELKKADIVITNPPFSLFREYISLLFEYDKKFLVLGNLNALSCKEIFALIKNDKIWLGVHNGSFAFKVPDNYNIGIIRKDKDGNRIVKLGNISWFTNIDNPRRHKNLVLTEDYKKELYPVYENYNAIEVSRIKKIPKNYKGLMGVPITFIIYHNPKQFEIVGIDKYLEDNQTKDRFVLNGKRLYARIVIKKK